MHANTASEWKDICVVGKISECMNKTLINNLPKNEN